MSYTAQETKEQRATVALELARFIALERLAKDRNYLIDLEDFNKIMVVAGMPLLTPGEVHAKEIDVIQFNQEDEA
jgi:hypothetical protein